jgi:hypothetical protein
MKEAPGSPETSVLTRATGRNNPEDTILQNCKLYFFILSPSKDQTKKPQTGNCGYNDYKAWAETSENQ